MGTSSKSVSVSKCSLWLLPLEYHSRYLSSHLRCSSEVPDESGKYQLHGHEDAWFEELQPLRSACLRSCRVREVSHGVCGKLLFTLFSRTLSYRTIKFWSNYIIINLFFIRTLGWHDYFCQKSFRDQTPGRWHSHRTDDCPFDYQLLPL